MIRIIGLGYRMGVGKDTAASFLVDTGYTRHRFSDSLKLAACTIFGWDRDDLEDLDFKMTVDQFWGMTPRTILQKFGTDAVRNNIAQNVWIKSLQRRIQHNSDGAYVITDVRFVNEAMAIKAWGGKLIKVVRPGWTPPGLTQQQMTHPSETELDGYEGWDAVIANDGDLASLKGKVLETERMLYEETPSWQVV